VHVLRHDSSSQLTVYFSKDRATPTIMAIFGQVETSLKRLVVPALPRVEMLPDEFATIGVGPWKKTYY
jgi:hypothetical protein